MLKTCREHTHHLDVSALAQKLLDRLGAVPEPCAQQDQIANHHSRPVLLFSRADRLALLSSAVHALRVLTSRHHQVADDQLDQADLVIVIGAERYVPSKLLGMFRVTHEVGEKEAREERAVWVEWRVGGGWEFQKTGKNDLSRAWNSLGRFQWWI